MDTKNKPTIECCEHSFIHAETVNAVRAKMPADELLFDLAEFFKVFGDSTRTRILWALDEAELCVCDLAGLLGMSQSAVSHQLRTLKQAKLVRNRREGKNIFYALDDEHIRGILEMGLTHISE